MVEQGAHVVRRVAVNPTNSVLCLAACADQPPTASSVWSLTPLSGAADTGSTNVFFGQPNASGSAVGSPSATRFSSPTGITIDGTDANLYVTDTGNARVVRLPVAPGCVRLLSPVHCDGCVD